jgi:hypothetical protein
LVEYFFVYLSSLYLFIVTRLSLSDFPSTFQISEDMVDVEIDLVNHFSCDILNVETDQVMSPSTIIISYFTDLFLSESYLGESGTFDEFIKYTCDQRLKPLTSTRKIDHSSAANNNCLNVDTDQVMSPSTIIISYLTDLFLSES